MARKFVIQTAVADLRETPQEFSSHDYSHQALRTTQLIFAEKLELVEEREEWLRILTLEQTFFDEKKESWSPFCGWIKRSEAREVSVFLQATHVICFPSSYSYGTYLPEASPYTRSLPLKPSRQQLVSEARLFLGAPYLWGGRASYSPQTIASVDCSGLINLLYRAQGIQIPRNAYDQCLFGKPTPHLLPGDALYLAKETRVNHVVLKLDENTFLEAPETGKQVRLLLWGNTIWEKEGRIHIFDRPHSYQPHPRSFI